MNMHQRGPSSHPIIHRTKHTVAALSNPPGTGLLSVKMISVLKSQLEHCGRKSAQEGLAGCRGQVAPGVRIRRRRGCDMIEHAQRSELGPSMAEFTPGLGRSARVGAIDPQPSTNLAHGKYLSQTYRRNSSSWFSPACAFKDEAITP